MLFSAEMEDESFRATVWASRCSSWFSGIASRRPEERALICEAWSSTYGFLSRFLVTKILCENKENEGNSLVMTPSLLCQDIKKWQDTVLQSQ